MKNTRQIQTPSPLGRLRLVASEDALVGVFLPDQETSLFSDASPAEEGDRLLSLARFELEAYFSGDLRRFSVPLAFEGTPFQRAVWNALSTIPYGETRSYAWLAREVGNPRAVRAVGAANARNRISIIVPCHRVIASNRSLCGYAGGLDAKRWLLEHEQDGSYTLERGVVDAGRSLPELAR